VRKALVSFLLFAILALILAVWVNSRGGERARARSTTGSGDAASLAQSETSAAGAARAEPGAEERTAANATPLVGWVRSGKAGAAGAAVQVFADDRPVEEALPSMASHSTAAPRSRAERIAPASGASRAG
jgi:hypothetical protein